MARMVDTAKTTSAQQLGSIIKSVRDIMRKDKGLNGDMDRLPMLTWLLFLKFLDDKEQEDEVAALLDPGQKYRPAIAAPYRWRDWAAHEDGLSGEQLIAFINHDEVTSATGEQIKGLFKYLRELEATPGLERRAVIANVFQGTINRMVSGYLLRDCINQINKVHFTSRDEIHTLGHLYESMLREMRDAAGDGGEFYTPRAVVRMMVTALDPRLGERVLDPACGTGGFLVEAYNHLEDQAKTNDDVAILKDRSIFGGEAKPLPYMLGQMNLLLHGLDAPQIDYGNALRFDLSQIGEGERMEVILTNPPFGGEEERGIQGNFPHKTSETALLFMQLIMRKLRMQPRQGCGPARAAVVVPNGTLFGDGVAARIKQDLLEQFNLHTIVRLPNGVFAPYTSIPTNVLFFARGGPTEAIWYYEQPLPAGRKNYSKTKPIQFEEFADLLAWWPNRAENDQAWRVDVEQIRANGFNLDVKNPNAAQDIAHLPPEQLVADILVKEARITELMHEIQQLLAEGLE